MYGLTLLVAIAVCIWITGHRYVNRGGDWDLIFRCAVWGVGAGIVGARLYHLATSWNEVPDQWWGPFAIWKGGLGVWGGIALGCIVGAIVAKRAGADVAVLADCLAPGLLVAQGIGRIGNWWNQELYGKATDLPWGLEIDPAHRPFSSIDAGHLPPDLPLRAALGLLRRGPARVRDRAPLPAAASGPLCALHRDLLVRPLLGRAASGSTPPTTSSASASTRGSPGSRASPASSGSCSSSAVAATPAGERPRFGGAVRPRAAGRAEDGRAQGPRPTGGLGSPAWPAPSAISSWTSTRSRARSTSC